MNLTEILAVLRAKNIELSLADGKLRAQGNRQALQDPAVLALLREYKPALIAAIEGGSYTGRAAPAVPPNRLTPDCTRVTPELLPLVALSQNQVDAIVAGVPGGAANLQDVYPLAPLQDGILFHHRIAQQGDVYLTSRLLGFASRAHLDRYAAALDAVIARHDILRTAFAWEGLAEALQVVWRSAPLPVDEFHADPGAGPVADQLRARFNLRHYRLDLSQAPLLRLHVAPDPANGGWVALQLMHHLIGDQTTTTLLQEEVQALLAGQAAPLAPPVPFRNFIAQARLGVSADEHRAFFTAMLGDVEEASAPFGLRDVQGDGSQIVEAQRQLPAGFGERLRAAARALGVSAAGVCHLAWALVLGRACGSEDVVFGTLMFGRMQAGEGADRALGMFINTLPLRVKLGEQGVREAVRATHQALSALLRHEHAPLALAQRCSAVRAPAPLFTSMLNYRHDGADGDQVGAGLAGAAWEGVSVLWEEERTNYPFGAAITDNGARFLIDVQVDAVLDPQRVCALLESALEVLVEALEGVPDTPLSALDILPSAQRGELLALGHGGAAPMPGAANLYDLVAAQAARNPRGLALVAGEVRLTYAELTACANGVAQALSARGAGPERLVAILADRFQIVG